MGLFFSLMWHVTHPCPYIAFRLMRKSELSNIQNNTHRHTQSQIRGIAHTTIISELFHQIAFTIVNTPPVHGGLPAFINKMRGNHYYLTAVFVDIRLFIKHPKK
jgi:hypothetical protein